MKKIVPILLVIAMSFNKAHAQIQKGYVFVGADIANLNLSLNTGSNFSGALNPKAAWFIRNDLALGGYVNFGVTTAKGAGSTVTYGIGPLARYYFNDSTKNLTGRGRFFIEANAGIEGRNPAVGESTNGLGLGIGPGFVYFITRNVGLEALVKYELIVGFGSSVTSSNILANFGVQIYLPGKTLRDAYKMNSMP
jgi:hypothetical protein